MILDRFGVPQEPEEGYVIAYDWRDEPIFDTDGEHYFNTEHGYVMNDPYELESYFKYVWGNPQHVSEEV